MRVVRTGTEKVFTLEFVKNYLKIDPDITIEDDVVSAAIDAAVEEANQLYMFIVLMNTYEVIFPAAKVDDTEGVLCLDYVRPVQRLIEVKVKEWDSSNDLVDVATLTEDTDYTYEIGAEYDLTLTLTDTGKDKIDKNQLLVVDVFAGTYQSAEEIPGDMKKPMWKMIADSIENRVDENVKSGMWRSSDRQIFLRREWHF